MQRRFIISMAGGAGLGVLLVQGLAWAQGTAPLRRVGVLQVVGEPVSLPLRAAFRRGMQELGWIEGRNVEYRFVSAEGQEGRLDALAASLVAARMDVIVTSSAVSVRSLQKATKTIPIVTANVVDPVANGFAASLARPGGNITGLSNQQEDVFPKLVEFLHQLAPKAQRIGFLFNENNPSYAAYREAAYQACAALGLSAILVTASAPAQLAGAVEQVVGQRAQGLVVVADPFYTSRSGMLQQLLQATRLPVVYGLRVHVDQGGLLSYGVNLDASWQRAAKFVDRILKGEKAGELPIEQPTRFELVLNMKTAKSLGLKIPHSILLQATEVIE